MDAIAISGWAMMAVGLAIAAIQTYRVKKLAKRNREQLEMFIEDADDVSFEHEIIDEIARKRATRSFFGSWSRRTRGAATCIEASSTFISRPSGDSPTMTCGVCARRS